MARHEEIISAHFGEIALKGGNRTEFENRLISNIRAQLGGSLEKIEKRESRLLLYPSDMGTALGRLGKVFGIEWFSPALSVERDTRAIIEGLLHRKEALRGKVRITAKRTDKTFPLTSPQISREVGIALGREGLDMVLKDHDRTVLIELLHDRAIVSFDRREGAGGLPYGSSGKLLSLLSGGIDSPAASWMMMRRGCAVDFLHLHARPSNDDVKNSKMARMLKALGGYSPVKPRLFLAPYTEFYKKSADMDPRSELVVFRRFMLRLANRIAEKEGHLGLITGDSVGQVASQTLENLRTANEASTLPVYRPLAGHTKQEITDMSKKIGTYEISVEEYKDCCSLVSARHPATRTKLEPVRKMEEEADIEGIVERTLEQTEIVYF